MKDEKTNALTEGSNSSSFDDFMKKLTYSTDPYWYRHLLPPVVHIDSTPIGFENKIEPLSWNRYADPSPVIILPENLNENETN